MTRRAEQLESIQLFDSTVPWRVAEFLGEGGQGRVYKVIDPAGNELALKWYHPEWATQEQWDTLETLVNSGPPDGHFLWPIERAVSPGAMQFGYVMRVREPRFHEISDHLHRKVTPSFRALATCGLQLADGFLQLHTNGLCYRDISWGNVFFDPVSGDVLICDNDNVGIDGKKTSIAGTRMFMAPEIVRHEAQPSTKTDRFSLAVLLFTMLMIHHPLLGRREAKVGCLDGAAFERLLGTEPVFVFDPDDKSNRPVPGEHDNALVFWKIYPQFIRDLFTQAFTVGLNDTGRRVTEGVWRGAMVRLMDAVFACGHCGQQNFYEAGRRLVCCSRNCGGKLKAPPRLVIDENEVVLSIGSRLYPHHLLKRRFDFSAPLAEVREHAEFDAIGLANLSDDIWNVTTDTGAAGKVAPGQLVTVAAGITVDFGRVTGVMTA